MKKRFKSRKNHSHKLLLFIIIALISFYITYNVLFNKLIKKNIDDENITKYLLYNNLNLSNQNKIDDIINVNLKNPLNILNYNFNNLIKSDEEVFLENEDAPIMEDPQKDLKIEKPIVYIYSTHQTEEYSMSYQEAYSINPTVMLASYLLRERLNDLSIPTIVETTSMSEVRKENNWTYDQGYRASRLLMKSAKNKHPTLNYFIDLHRDAATKEITTTTIDGKSYAKILFVIGKDADKYEENLKFAKKINEELKKYDPSLSRGIFLREGPSVNGIYNQDFNNRTILIELGCQYNTIEEVSNTIEVLSKSLYDVIGEDYE